MLETVAPKRRISIASTAIATLAAGCKNAIDRTSGRIGVVLVRLPHPLELAAAALRSFISPRMNLHLQLLVHMLVGWVNRHQQSMIEYLQAENRALRGQLGPKRIRWTDEPRLRLSERPRPSDVTP